MEHEGDISLLARLARGEGRTGLLILSGVMRGVYGGAMATALETRGLQNAFTSIVGISTGVPVALYFASGTVHRGNRIYWEEASTTGFISFSLQRMIHGTTADVGFLASVFRGEIGSNPVPIDAMRLCAADVHLALTNWNTGKGELIDAKSATPDPIEAIRAAIAMPLLYRVPVFVNGIRYVDGGIGLPFPSREMVAKWNLDGLIVFANWPKDAPISPLFQGKATSRMLSPALGDMLRSRASRFDDGVRFVRESGIRHLIVWTDGKVGAFARNPLIIERGAERAFNYMNILCASAGL